MTLNNQDYILLDVRTNSEYQQSHLDGAINFDYYEMLNGKLPNIDKNKIVKVYCLSGVRASAATDLLIKNGYKNAISIGGLDSANSIML
jgi:rhodanese-related sulfurtransferase